MNQDMNTKAHIKKISIGGLLGVLLLLTILIGALPGYAAVDAVPPWRETAKLTSDGAEDDQFGWAAAVSGTTVVVGMNHVAASDGTESAGTVYVYERPGTGWTDTNSEAAKLYNFVTDDNGTDDDNFASAVDINGDTIVAGAPGFNGGEGVAFVYVKSDSGWVNGSFEDVVLTASDGGINHFFGKSVAVSGDIIIVGAEGANGGKGAVYLYVKPEAGWESYAGATIEETSILLASDGMVSDLFGRAVSASADTVVVGAEGVDVLEDTTASQPQIVALPLNDAGQAYVFVKPGDGWPSGDSNSMTETVLLKGDPPGEGDFFGSAVDIHDDTIVVGAKAAPGESSAADGKVYVFVKPPDASWPTAVTATLTASDGAAGDNFGGSVGVSGDTIVVGAEYHEEIAGRTAGLADADPSNRGAVYIYVREASGWAATADEAILLPSDLADDDYLGTAVSISGGTVAAGARGKDIVSTTTNANQGQVYVFQGDFCTKSSGTWNSDTIWVGENAPGITDDACVTTGDTVTLTADGSSRRLLVNPEAILDLDLFNLSVEDFVTNNGTMQQVGTVNTPDGSVTGSAAVDGSVEFLFLQNAPSALNSISGSETKYKGAKLIPIEDLGDMKVSIRETIGWLSPSARFKYCTSTGASSPDNMGRCFKIGPKVGFPAAGLVADARVGLYADRYKLNSVPRESLIAYHKTAAGWVPLGDLVIGPCCILDYFLVEGQTDSFSQFLLAESTPTAVQLIALEAGTITPNTFITVAVVLLGLTGIVILLYKRRNPEMDDRP